METQFIVGNTYSIKEIEENGFIKAKQTSLVLFYRRDKVLLAFNIPKPLDPKIYKLMSYIID